MEGLGRVAMLGLALASARILEPAQIGVLGLSVIVAGLISILGAFTEVGAAIAEGVETDQDRAWAGTFWRLLVTAATALGVLAAREPIATLLGGDKDQAAALQALMTFLLWLPWIETVSAYPRIILRRNRDFGYLAQQGFLGTVVFVGSAVGLLWVERRPEAVVTAQLMSATLTSGLTWLRLLQTGYRNARDTPSRSDVAKVGRESFKLFLGSSGGYVSERFDNLLVAANLGSALLPFYSVAWNLCRTPVALVSQASSNIITAVAVERGDANRLGQTLKNTYRFTYLIMAISAAVLFFVAPMFIEPVLGRKWIELTPMLRILAVGLLFAPAQISAGTYLVSQGWAHLIGFTSGIHILAQLALIPPLCARFGVAGAGYADIANNALVISLLCIAVKRSGGDFHWLSARTTAALTLAVGFAGGLAAFLASRLLSDPLLMAVVALALTLVLFPLLAMIKGEGSFLKEAANIVTRWARRRPNMPEGS